MKKLLSVFYQESTKNKIHSGKLKKEQKMINKFPKTRKELPDAYQKIYVEHYSNNRNGSTMVSSISMKLESWMHKMVATTHSNNCTTLEIGAGTLNQLDFEKKSKQYDIIEPFEILYKDSKNISSIDNFFLIAPNKHSIYPEFYPFQRPEGLTRTDQFTDALDKYNVDYFYPRDYLISLKEKNEYPLYYETDTHWNTQASYYVYTILKERIENLFPDVDFPSPDFNKTVTVGGLEGNVPLLGLKPSGKMPKIDFSPREGWESFYSYVFTEDYLKTIHQEDLLPKAIIYRDSFFTELQPFTSLLFSDAEYRWKGLEEIDKESILKNKPDIIIFEAVERFIHWISYSDFVGSSVMVETFENK